MTAPDSTAPFDRAEPFDRAGLDGLIDGRTDAEIGASVVAMGTDVALGRAFATAEASFDAELAGEVSVVIQWDVATPEGPRTWQIAVSDGAASATVGTVTSPRVTLGVDVSDLLRFLAGRLDGMQAFMSGRLRVSGDLMVAQAMQAWFNPVG